MGNSSSRVISSESALSTATPAALSREMVLTPSVASAPHRTMFENLPKEIVLKIGTSLTFQQKARLAITSKSYHGFFQPKLRVSRFLLLIVRGEQDAADAMLKEYPELMLAFGDVTDYSGRTFKNITGYDYSYWAMDKHMCRMLEAHMDNATKPVMLQRIDAMEKNGLTYEQLGVLVKHSKYFDFTPLIRALKYYLTHYNDWLDTSDWLAMRTAWMDVGLAQCDMVIHVANEYLYPHRSFFYRPTFNEETLPRSLIFYTFAKKPYPYTLFPLIISDLEGLGVDIALIGNQARGCDWMGEVSDREVFNDLMAIVHLEKVRTADLTESRKNLLTRTRGQEFII